MGCFKSVFSFLSLVVSDKFFDSLNLEETISMLSFELNGSEVLMVVQSLVAIVGRHYVNQFVTAYKEWAVKEAIWKMMEISVISQFPKLRLEDKSLIQEGVIVMTRIQNEGPSESLAHRHSNMSPWLGRCILEGRGALRVSYASDDVEGEDWLEELCKPLPKYKE
jgi:hypothetical protein